MALGPGSRFKLMTGIDFGKEWDTKKNRETSRPKMQIITLTYKKEGEPQNRLIVVYRLATAKATTHGEFDSIPIRTVG